MPVALPHRYKPGQLAPAPAAKIQTLPPCAVLADRGPGPGDVQLETSRLGRRGRNLLLRPHKPWQRGTNENQRSAAPVLSERQRDLSVHSEADLSRVAAELNDRPCKRFGFPQVRRNNRLPPAAIAPFMDGDFSNSGSLPADHDRQVGESRLYSNVRRSSTARAFSQGRVACSRRKITDS